MATETTTTPTPSFASEQLTTVNRLSTSLTFVALLLIPAGLIRIAIGGLDIVHGNWSGLLAFPAGALLAFAGLALWAGASDAKYLHDVKGREKEHLSNTFDSINTAFTALLIFGCYEALLAFINIWA